MLGGGGGGGARMYVRPQSTRRNNMDACPSLKLILMLNEKVMLFACSVLRQITTGDSKQGVNQKHLGRDQSRRQLEVLEEVQASQILT